MRFWEYDEVQIYATIASCFVYALPLTLACSSHACCRTSTLWRMITLPSVSLVVSRFHPLTSAREREIPEDLKDLIHRLAVRSYKECLEHMANCVRTVYRKKIIPKKYNSLHAFNYFFLEQLLWLSFGGRIFLPDSLFTRTIDHLWSLWLSQWQLSLILYSFFGVQTSTSSRLGIIICLP